MFLIKPLFLHDQKVKTIFRYSENKKRFKGKIKNDFLAFLKGFQFPEIVSDLKVRQ